jgi:hypothetical protein
MARVLVQLDGYVTMIRFHHNFGILKGFSAFAGEVPYHDEKEE